MPTYFIKVKRINELPPLFYLIILTTSFKGSFGWLYLFSFHWGFEGLPLFLFFIHGFWGLGVLWSFFVNFFFYWWPMDYSSRQFSFWGDRPNWFKRVVTDLLSVNPPYETSLEASSMKRIAGSWLRTLVLL